MNPIHDLSLGKPPGQMNVFIEIPRGSKNKFELDKDTGLITLDRVLSGSEVYPFDYGLLPQTHWHDGDSLDALVLNTAEPYFPGTVVPTRPVGVIRMIDDGDKDEKIVCVPVEDVRWSKVKDLPDVDQAKLKEFKKFFENYKKLEGKKVTIGKMEGRKAAEAVIDEAVQLYKAKK
jgi:inorganic pyrophosphatase